MVLGPYSPESGKTNVLLDMPLPQSDEPVALRKQSREFHELSEFVVRRAYGACAAQVKEELSGEQGEAQ